MHIPSCPSQEIDLISFEEALARSGKGDDYDHDRWIYVPDFYTEYRYILGTRGDNPLICIGINPSTAEPDNLDNTLKSVSRIAAGNGFDSFIMFNVYAQRATSPDDMDRCCNDKLHRENMKAFDYLLSRIPEGTRPAIWAAWGAIIEKREYLMDCVRDMADIGRSFEAVWLKAGQLSKKGHPHHPLYLKKDCPLEPFPMEEYLRKTR